MNTLLSSCEDIVPFDTDEISEDDQECFVLATQFYLGIYAPEMERMDRRAG